MISSPENGLFDNNGRAGAERYGVSVLLEQPRVATPIPNINTWVDVIPGATGVRARAR